MPTVLLVLGSMFAMVALFYLIVWCVKLFRSDDRPSIDPSDVIDLF